MPLLALTNATLEGLAADPLAASGQTVIRDIAAGTVFTILQTIVNGGIGAAILNAVIALAAGQLAMGRWGSQLQTQPVQEDGAVAMGGCNYSSFMHYVWH
ncbi:hypothetical protein QBC41DRAFT_307925 [Cercophora samala]|uniref:Uncharacterized protein n=1 Tax=Cercophora samala TaxID=330535 RepID=A0AA40D2J9_9PEZI|nr:hypothetical protein QBC41DRAFT_307925 [Cercophora samala]